MSDALKHAEHPFVIVIVARHGGRGRVVTPSVLLHVADVNNEGQICVIQRRNKIREFLLLGLAVGHVTDQSEREGTILSMRRPHDDTERTREAKCKHSS